MVKLRNSGFEFDGIEANWAAKMVVATDASMSWVMCKQDDGPDPMVSYNSLSFSFSFSSHSCHQCHGPWRNGKEKIAVPANLTTSLSCSGRVLPLGHHITRSSCQLCILALAQQNIYSVLIRPFSSSIKIDKLSVVRCVMMNGFVMAAKKHLQCLLL